MKSLIETERLLLREITLEDKEHLFKLHSHPDVQKYTGEAVVESLGEMEKPYFQELETIKNTVTEDGPHF